MNSTDSAIGIYEFLKSRLNAGISLQMQLVRENKFIIFTSGASFQLTPGAITVTGNSTDNLNPPTITPAELMVSLSTVAYVMVENGVRMTLAVVY